MKYKVMLNEHCFKEKPKAGQIVWIRPKFSALEMDLAEMMEAIEKGQSIMPAVLEGTKSEGFLEQQIFMVDIDNEREGEILLSEQAYKICKENKLPLVFDYETFSSTPEKPKYRLVFAMDKVIADKAERDRFMVELIDFFPQADPACKDASRIFYGTNKKCLTKFHKTASIK